MREFKVNEYITLRLENGQSIIYLGGERFDQCKFLLLDIPIDEIKSFDEIESIDEAEEKLKPLIDINGIDEIQIPPEIEFWGHCSNLQTWYENDYNTKLLHRNLAFPLLKKLAELGDILAKKVFKEEIAKRLENFYPSVFQFLINERYIDYLEGEDIYGLLDFTNFKFLTLQVNNLF